MSHTITQARKQIRKAFTLIEIMVSMTVMVIIILFVLQLTSNVLSSWNNGISAISSNTEARLALNLIARDLESAVIRNNPSGITWLEVEKEPIGFGTGSNTIDAAWLKFITQSVAERDKSKDGDVSAVSYRLSWQWQLNGTDPSTGSENYKTFGLHRAIVDTDTTFVNFMTNTANWGSVDTDEPNDLIASNVVGFAVTIHWFDGSDYGRTTVGPTLSSYSADSGNKSYLSDDAKIESPAPLFEDGEGNSATQITAIEATLTILNDEGVRILNRIVEGKTTFADVTNGGNQDDFIVRYSRTFSRRVNVSNTNML